MDFLTGNNVQCNLNYPAQVASAHLMAAGCKTRRILFLFQRRKESPRGALLSAKLTPERGLRSSRAQIASDMIRDLNDLRDTRA